MKKEEELTLQLQNKEKSTDKLLAELLVLRKKYDEDLRDMTDFMDEHYPPHVVDGAGPLGDECLLKAIVEVCPFFSMHHAPPPSLTLTSIYSNC